ncbi:MAG: glycoside hydrolase family 16 protein, partial [Planctomycetes bacterium]|nr:glycoside hydrolase family 16 protein [Planctomycetota bacterium]
MWAQQREWPASGEIDIMESYQAKLHANAAWSSATRWKPIWNAVGVPYTTLAKEAGFADATAWAQQFHTWRMDWNETLIRLFVDGRLMNEIDVTKSINETADHMNPLREPHFMIVNLAIGAISGDPAKSTFPAQLEVDWIRIYQ